MLFLILRWATHRRHWLQRRGVVAGLFLLFYGLFRIALENVRKPDEGLERPPAGPDHGHVSVDPDAAGRRLADLARPARAAAPPAAAAGRMSLKDRLKAADRGDRADDASPST